MKMAVIGGGGVRSPLLARSIAYHAQKIHLNQVVFMDNDLTKLHIYGKISQQVAQQICPELDFSLTDSFEEAVKDADYIITTIRVGNDEMRIIDERLALKYGVIGQETTGASGISFAMRSVSILSQYCEVIRQISKKDVKVFNFTNPAGIVTQTLRDMGYEFCYGICDAPTSLINSIIDIMDYDPEQLSFDCFGLNHFSFITSVKYKGKEVIDSILSNTTVHQQTDLRFIDLELMKNKHMLFNEYLYYYLYPQEAYQNISQSPKIRSEIIKEINDSMTSQLQSIDIEKNLDEALRIYSKCYNLREESYMQNETGKTINKKPFVFDIKNQSQNGYASIALDYIMAVENDIEKNVVLCTRNDVHSILDKDDIIEVTCTIDQNGVKVHHVEIEDPLIIELLRRMKTYEKMASRALISHKKQDFIDCLMLNPLVSSYSIAKGLTDDFFEVNKDYFDESL